MTKLVAFLAKHIWSFYMQFPIHRTVNCYIEEFNIINILDTGSFYIDDSATPGFNIWV